MELFHEKSVRQSEKEGQKKQCMKRSKGEGGKIDLIYYLKSWEKFLTTHRSMFESRDLGMQEKANKWTGQKQVPQEETAYFKTALLNFQYSIMKIG